MSEFESAKKVIGEEIIQKLLDHVREGHMLAQELEDFARLLGANNSPNTIYGNHRRRMEQLGEGSYDSEFKSIIGDWWSENLFELSSNAAIHKLIRICSDPSLPRMRPLTKTFRRFLTTDEPNCEKLCTMNSKLTPGYHTGDNIERQELVVESVGNPRKSMENRGKS